MEFEITTEILNDKQAAFDILKSKGFHIVGRFEIKDYYYTHLKNEGGGVLDYADLIGSSMLVRYVSGKDGVIKWLMYKSKTFDTKGQLIGEQKFKTNIDDIDVTRKMFDMAGFYNWVNQDTVAYIFKRGDLELIVQDCGEHGLFVEIERFKEGQSREELIELAKGLGLSLGTDFDVKKPYLIYSKQRLQ